MIIIGINAYHADSSAAIFVDGTLVAAIEEERFKRIKHWSGFPSKAIQFCLSEAGIKFEEVDFFAIGKDPVAKIIPKLTFLAAHPFVNMPFLKDRLINSRFVYSIEEELSTLSGLPESFFNKKVIKVEHHRSHISSAFFASPFEEAACLSIDGSGDFTTTMIGVGKGHDIEIIDSVDFPHSLGLFYSAFTQLLGFPNYGDEYKIMGLAPYGNPKYLDKLNDVIKLTPDGLFKLNLSYFKTVTSGLVTYESNHIPVVSPLAGKKLLKVFGPVRSKEEDLTQYHKDLAASVQVMTEHTIFHILKNLQKRTGLKNLCLAGGVAQNSVANGKIKKNTGFQNIYIPSAGHDAGISMGAAFYVQHVLYKMSRQKPIYSAYTGSRFSNDYISEMLKSRDLPFQLLNDEVLMDVVTDCIINGGVVGWFQGKSEFGPRALGGRSILADPRRKDAKDLLNLKIKRRESFRPFAPSILEEFVADYFEDVDSVPFMEKVFIIKESKRSALPAVCHIDGTGRLQTVSKVTSPKYHNLIEKFYHKTNIPVLLNTSFNENEPIVNTPEEALDCFIRTKMDMLVMENILLKR